MWQIMFLQSWFLAAAFLLEIPTGVVADKWGRKQSLIIGGIFGTLGALLYVVYPNFWWFLMCETLFAVGSALLSGADDAIVFDSLKETNQLKDSKIIFSYLENAKLIGIMIGAPLGSLVAKYIDMRAPFFLWGLAMLISTIVAFSLHEPKEFKERDESRRYLDILKTGFSYLLKHRVFWILALDFSVVYLMGYLALWFYQKKLLLLNFDIAYFGFVHFGFTLSQVIFVFYASKLEKLLKSKRRLLFLTTLLTGFLLLIIGWFSNVYLVIPAIILVSAVSLGRKPLFSNYFNQQITVFERATVLSALSMIQKMVIFICAPIFGYFADFSLNYVFIFLGVVAIIFAFGSRVKEEYLLN